MACYHTFITFITGFFIVFSLSLSVGASVCACAWGGFSYSSRVWLILYWFVEGARRRRRRKWRGRSGGEVRGWGGREREMWLCVFVTRAHREQSGRGRSARKITWSADLYLGKVKVWPDWLVLSFPPVFGVPLPPPCIPRSSCVLMPLRTRGGEEGEKSEEEEADEGEVRRPGHFSSLPFGSLSSLPSWTCMDGHGESWMLLPRGWAPRLPVSGASLPATAAADHRSQLRCSHR